VAASAGRAFGTYVYEKLLEDSVMAFRARLKFPLAVKRQSRIGRSRSSERHDGPSR